MIILLDADGPLFDLTGASVQAVNKKFGTDYTPDMWTEWDATFMEKHQVAWLKEVPWRDGAFWENLPPTVGAVEGVTRLRVAGHELHVVTSSFESCDVWERSRRRALRSCFGIHHKFVTVTSQKHLVHGDIFVDDKVEHVEAWGDRFDWRSALLFAMPHNQGAGCCGRVTWAQIVGAFT